jgi:16S rRNA U516 pseudouridylate synthase RsuA-like enzyme
MIMQQLGAQFLQVGRLDQHSCGLLLFTTDGRLTRHLIDPLKAISRQYECVVRGAVRFDWLDARMRAGVVPPLPLFILLFAKMSLDINTCLQS